MITLAKLTRYVQWGSIRYKNTSCNYVFLRIGSKEIIFQQRYVKSEE